MVDFGDAHGAVPALPTPQEFTNALLEMDTKETVAVARVCAELTGDALLANRATTALRSHTSGTPQWLAQISRTIAVRTVSLTSVLHHEETILLEMSTGGAPFTLAVAIAHAGSSFLEDAYPVGMSVERVLDSSSLDDENVIVNDVSLADARARISEVIDMSDHMLPPIETDSWPLMRHLLTWALTLLPTGGNGFDPHEWTPEEIEEYVDDFMDSSWAKSLNADARFDARLLLDFQATYGSNQPLRWGSDFTARVLLDLIPRKIIAPADELLTFPAVLRALIPWANSRSGVPSGITQNALEVVDDVEEDFRALVTGDALEGDDSPPGVFDDLHTLLSSRSTFLDFAMWELWRLEEEVGGSDALKNLDEGPLPVEDFQTSGIPEDIVPRVQNLARQVGELADDVFQDAEMKTSAFRVLAAAATRSPQVFRRRFTDPPTVASICWITGRINHWFDPGVPERTVGRLMQVAGVKNPPGQRAAALRSAIRPAEAMAADSDGPLAAFDDEAWDPAAQWLLGDAHLLTGAARTTICEERDRLQLRIEDLRGEDEGDGWV